MEDMLYDLVESVDDLIILNIAYLKGILKSNYYQGGPILVETVNLVDNLIKLNKKGFLSVEGQPGENTIKKQIRNREDYYIQIEKKAYIIGYIHKSRSEQIKKLLNNEDYYIRISNPQKHIYNNIKFTGNYYNLTRDKIANNLKQLKKE